MLRRSGAICRVCRLACWITWGPDGTGIAAGGRTRAYVGAAAAQVTWQLSRDISPTTSAIMMRRHFTLPVCRPGWSTCLRTARGSAAVLPTAAFAAPARAAAQQQRRTLTINGRYYDPFHPLHMMGILTLMIAGGCVKMILERRERVRVREEYQRQLVAADREAEQRREGAT